MATVGNLFVNVRGRTRGFEREMKKANRRVTKDFYISQGLALQDLRKQRERLGMMNLASDDRFDDAKQRLRRSEARMRIAQARPANLAKRRELIKQKMIEESERRTLRIQRRGRAEDLRRKKGELGAVKEFFTQTPYGQVTSVLGVLGLSVAGIRGLVGLARKGSQLTERFKFAGPAGTEIAKVEADKIMQQLRMAQSPVVQGSKLARSRADLEFEEIEMTFGAGLDYAVAGAKMYGDFFWNLVTGGVGFGMYKNVEAARRVTGLTGQAP